MEKLVHKGNCTICGYGYDVDLSQMHKHMLHIYVFYSSKVKGMFFFSSFSSLKLFALLIMRVLRISKHDESEKDEVEKIFISPSFNICLVHYKF